MARDYKSKRGKPAGFSGWMGVLFGLAAGLGVAGIVFIKDHRPEAPITLVGNAENKKFPANEPPETETGDTGAEQPAKSYDFYDRLPKFEVVLPEKEKDVRPDIKSVP